MVLHLFNKLVHENIIKNLKNQKLNIDQTAMNKYSLDCDLVKLKATVLNKMHSTNDLLFVKLVFQENYLPSRSVLDPLPAGETKKSTRKKTCALNSVKHFHVAKTAG